MTESKSGDPFCTHRWDRGDPTEPGPCQCRRWANHTGPHRCCCEQELATDD